MGAIAWFWKKLLLRPGSLRRALSDPRRLGRLGEWLAYEHLLERGFDVIARGWSAPFGEVDLIARRDGALHFIEVKTRQAGGMFEPADAVTREKQERYYRLAAYFLKEHHLRDISVRYHIVSIEFDDEGQHQLELLENAF